MPTNNRLSGQNLTILNHLQRHRSITPMQALALYGVFRLAAVVYRLRDKGYDITTKIKDDPNGHPYAEYRMTVEAIADSREAVAA